MQVMKLYKSSRTIISALGPAGAIKVWEQESGEEYPGEPDDWQELDHLVKLTFSKGSPIPFPNSAIVYDDGPGRFVAHDRAQNWADFWPNSIVSFEGE